MRKNRHVWTTVLAVSIVAIATLTLVGCKKDSEQPEGDHPAKVEEAAKAEHPTATEQPAKSEHPTSEHPAK